MNIYRCHHCCRFPDHYTQLSQRLKIYWITIMIGKRGIMQTYSKFLGCLDLQHSSFQHYLDHQYLFQCKDTVLDCLRLQNSRQQLIKKHKRKNIYIFPDNEKLFSNYRDKFWRPYQHKNLPFGNGASSSRHWHKVQRSVSTSSPQQSPPSKSHPPWLFSSSHTPSPFQSRLKHPKIQS